MTRSNTYDDLGNMVGETVGTNTITVYVGRKVGDNNYGNREAALHLQIDITEEDDFASMEEKIKRTFVFGQTLVDRQLGMDDTAVPAAPAKPTLVQQAPDAKSRAAHPTAARRTESRPLPKAVPAARKQAPKGTSNGSKDALWQNWLESPDDWWDNRPEITGEPKKNPRGPDLKHKKNGDALWIDSAPEWVKLTLNGEAEVF